MKHLPKVLTAILGVGVGLLVVQVVEWIPIFPAILLIIFVVLCGLGIVLTIFREL